MPNLTSVHVTGGIPDAGTGTVSTIDELILVGLPLTGGTVTLAGGTALVAGTVTAQISGGTSFISGGNVTAVVSGAVTATASINQGGAAISSTNGIFANVLFNNALVSASVGLPVNLVTYLPITAIVSGTTVVSGAVTATLNQAGAALSSTNGVFSNLLLNGTTISTSNSLPVQLASSSLQIGQVTAVMNVGGAAVSSTNGDFTNLLQNNGTLTPTNGIYANAMFGNTAVSSTNGMPVNLVSGTISIGSIGNTTFFSLQTGTWNDTLIQGGVALSSTNGIFSNLLQQNATLSPTNGLYANVLFGNSQVTAGNGLPVNLVSGSITIGNVTAAINQGGAAVSSTNGSYFNVLFNNTLVSATVGLPVNLLTYAALTAVISGTAFISGGNVTAVVSGTTFISGGNVTAQISGGTSFISGGNVTAQISGGTSFLSGGNITAAINQGGAALSSTNGIFANIILGNASISSTNPVMIEGETASGATDANNPIKIGGLAKSAQITSVTDGQRVNAVFDLQGKQVVLQSIRALKASFFTTISTTGEAVLVTGLATTFQDVYGAICANNSGSTIQLTFKDSAAGNTQFVLQVPSFDTRGFMMPESGALKQTSQSTAWTVTPSIATSISITLLYVKNATS